MFGIDWANLAAIAGYVVTTEDLFHSEQLNFRNFFQEIDHPIAGRARYTGPPFRIGDAPWVVGRAPLLGEHTFEVCTELLGYSADEVGEFVAEGVLE